MHARRQRYTLPNIVMGQRTPELLALAKVLNSPPKNIVFDFFEHIIKHIVMFAEMDGYDPAVSYTVRENTRTIFSHASRLIAL
jgi:hypothetical protein